MDDGRKCSAWSIGWKDEDIEIIGDPVTIGFMVTLMATDGGRKRKKWNGSPGRARTADLVINSRRDSYLCLFYDQDSQDFFCRICGLVLSTEPIPSLSGSVGTLLGEFFWSFRMGSSGCPFLATEPEPNWHRSRRLWSRVGQPGPEYPGVQNARESGTLGSRGSTGGDARASISVVPD